MVNVVVECVDDVWFDLYVLYVSVVFDCIDNFVMWYVINCVCVVYGVLFVLGVVLCFDGQISMFDFCDVVVFCYVCVFLEDQLFEEVVCLMMGVFVLIVGIIGVMQVVEVLCVIGGIGKMFNGWLMMFDLLWMEWMMMKIVCQVDCFVCGGWY